MAGDGDAKKPKDDVLASIRKIMRGGSADLGKVPAPGSKAGGDASSEPEDDWSLPPGSLSEAEGGAPADNSAVMPPSAAPPAAAPDDEDDDDDDDFLPLSPAMQVEPAAAATPTAGFTNEPDTEMDDGEEALDLSTISAGTSADDLMIEDDVQVIREDTGAPVTAPDWAPTPVETEDEPGSGEELADAVDPGDDSGADPFASLRKQWDLPGEQAAAAEDGEADEPDAAAAPEDNWDDTPEAAAEDAEAATGPQDDGADWDAEPALTLGEIEDTIRRVVREELEGETGQRLSQNIRRLVLNEIARAMQRTD